jgi:hypothetical protein
LCNKNILHEQDILQIKNGIVYSDAGYDKLLECDDNGLIQPSISAKIITSDEIDSDRPSCTQLASSASAATPLSDFIRDDDRLQMMTFNSLILEGEYEARFIGFGSLSCVTRTFLMNHASGLPAANATCSSFTRSPSSPSRFHQFDEREHAL